MNFNLTLKNKGYFTFSPIAKRLSILFTSIVITAAVNAGAQTFALKSNLLYDAALSPNLGIEVGIAPKWSVDLSGNFNNWSVSGHQWKHWFVQPEARYWLCERFGGHFFAAHAIAGEFNAANPHNFFEIRSRRNQGWGAGLGVGYGYTWMLSKHWSIETEIALGWIYMRYDVYPCASCGTKLENGRTHNYVGPTKAALNLIYTF